MPILTVKLGLAETHLAETHLAETHLAETHLAETRPVGHERLKSEVAALLLDLTARILGKKRELTAIVIETVDPRDWWVGGLPLAGQGVSSFYFDIRITDETNTKDEKARYIREAFEGLSRLLGPLHEESYIHVHDVRAASYGYGGLTQEFRYHH